MSERDRPPHAISIGRSAAWGHPALPLGFAVLPLLGLVAAVVAATGGRLVYMLDDAYIHLTLARNMAAGTYGLNPGELSAPSSSIAWPFLLVLFAPLGPALEFVPLALNVCCLSATALILNRHLVRMDSMARGFVLAGILLSLNLYGLAMTGMEHSLHVLLAAHLAQWLVAMDRRDDVMARQTFDRAGLLCLVALPLVRYEGLALSVPALIFMHRAGRKRAALFSGAAICLSMGAFSLFLERNGLGLLPSSVLAKSTFSGVEGLLSNLVSNLREHGAWLGIVLLFAWSIRRSSGPLAWVVLSSALLHFLFGRHGWFGRYEVYFVLFTVVLMLARFGWSSRAGVWGVAALCLMFHNLVWIVRVIPMAASNVFERQGRMASIARALDGPVAVNDIGMVGYRSGKYVLDLWGLGSRKALELRLANPDDPEWIAELMRASGVRYAMIYDSWFPKRPSGFIEVGRLTLPFDRVSADGPVTFYATDDVAFANLAATLRAYRSGDQSNRYALEVTPRVASVP